MAFQTAINRTIRQPGLHRSSARTLPVGLSRVTVRLDSDWPDTADVALLGIEFSPDDGTTWLHRVSAAIYGGRRNSLGDVPSITMRQPPPGLYRLFILLSTAVDLGIEIQVE